MSVAELLAAYDGVVLTYGAARDRHLDVPGEDLVGSIAATDLVAGTAATRRRPRGDRVGARDRAVRRRRGRRQRRGRRHARADRALGPPRRHRHAQHVLEALRDSSINDVHVLGRRGPAQATWTTKGSRSSPSSRASTSPSTTRTTSTSSRSARRSSRATASWRATSRCSARGPSARSTAATSTSTRTSTRVPPSCAGPRVRDRRRRAHRRRRRRRGARHRRETYEVGALARRPVRSATAASLCPASCSTHA